MTLLKNQQPVSFLLRLIVAAALMLLAFGLLGWRLYSLQALRYEELARQAETNRTAVVPIVPERGRILDRHGWVMAQNIPSFTLEITPSLIQQPLDALIEELRRFIPVSQQQQARFTRLKNISRSFDSLPLRSDLTEDEAARLAANSWRFPGVEVRARLMRKYPLGNIGGHITGYVGRINQQDKDRLEENGQTGNYRGSEWIGKIGIERQYEEQLHGLTGVEQMETSARGHATRSLAHQAATAGDDIQLSLDIRLQKLVQDMFGQRRGALVAIDPRNGDILAMVSMPPFDPNLFIEGFDQQTWDVLNDALDRPLFNRALRGTYPPGSTYKPFMALGALERGLRAPGDITWDGGTWTLAGHTFRSGHALGRVDLKRSIIKSSNVYYYQLAYDMGVDAIHDFMQALGFGQKTGIDLPGESSGILPSRAWKASAFKNPAQQEWFPGETISLGIGQGYNSFTILQLAHATAVLAAGGVNHTPRLLKGIRKTGQPDFQAVAPLPATDLAYDPEHVQVVLDAMAQVPVQGTSRFVFANSAYTSGGKTGTAQAISIGQKDRYDASRLAEYQRDHSLYIGFAPVENPVIAVAAIVENAGFGATGAAPIVRRVLDYWLTGAVPNAADLQAVAKGLARAPAAPARSMDDYWSEVLQQIATSKHPADEQADEQTENPAQTAAK